MTTKVKIHYGNPFVQILKNGAVAGILEQAASQVQSAAVALAPIEFGDYVGSIHVEVEEHDSRVVAHVVASDPKSHILEAKYGVLARAIDAAGGSS